MHQARVRPESTAFVFNEDVWTYSRLEAEAESVAQGLAANGVKPGDRVALHMMNCPEILVGYYACYRLGAIAAPLRTAFKFAELARYCSDCSLRSISVKPRSIRMLPRSTMRSFRGRAVFWWMETPMRSACGHGMT
ncbi:MULTISPECIES: AMP-binding protein [Bradyrhizobium]|uniref:AMP-binding protein n=1 Tax=Bradyrhizobium elkanii TaxID=29448 RepID=UPI0009B76C51|nr:class I adenylate-forming enzyme family protein [Bradyrhizobium elkanii]